eukprot:TRINITY_DN8789_c0_g1_i1.p1 TRINITY_DN8789_c0_g1~~TRINITY_DN8789_c0_g1_i1.p1  ORF type:complete len:1252 (+),score=285.50 TRINITY_DN8789_c0_g1_i1:140-3895(+)
MFKSLFEPKANDVVVDYDGEKSHLFLSLSRSVKKLHRLHANTNNEASNGNRQELMEVCGVLEQIFRHGLQSSWLKSEPSIWDVAVKITHKDDLASIKNISHATTDMARARAWLRLAMAQSSLESYVAVLTSSHDLVKSHYEAWAFLADQEQCGKLQALLASMSFTMDLDIRVDDASLSYEPAPAAAEVVVPTHVAQSTSTTSTRSEPLAVARMTQPVYDEDSPEKAEQLAEATPTIAVTENTATVLQATVVSTKVKTKKKKKKKKSKDAVSRPRDNSVSSLTGVLTPNTIRAIDDVLAPQSPPAEDPTHSTVATANVDATVPAQSFFPSVTGQGEMETSLAGNEEPPFKSSCQEAAIDDKMHDGHLATQVYRLRSDDKVQHAHLMEDAHSNRTEPEPAVDPADVRGSAPTTGALHSRCDADHEAVKATSMLVEDKASLVSDAVDPRDSIAASSSGQVEAHGEFQASSSSQLVAGSAADSTAADPGAGSIESVPDAAALTRQDAAAHGLSRKEAANMIDKNEADTDHISTAAEQSMHDDARSQEDLSAGLAHEAEGNTRSEDHKADQDIEANTNNSPLPAYTQSDIDKQVGVYVLPHAPSDNAKDIAAPLGERSANLSHASDSAIDFSDHTAGMPASHTDALEHVNPGTEEIRLDLTKRDEKGHDAISEPAAQGTETALANASVVVEKSSSAAPQTHDSELSMPAESQTKHGSASVRRLTGPKLSQDPRDVELVGQARTPPLRSESEDFRLRLRRVMASESKEDLDAADSDLLPMKHSAPIDLNAHVKRQMKQHEASSELDSMGSSSKPQSESSLFSRGPGSDIVPGSWTSASQLHAALKEAAEEDEDGFLVLPESLVSQNSMLERSLTQRMDPIPSEAVEAAPPATPFTQERDRAFAALLKIEDDLAPMQHGGAEFRVKGHTFQFKTLSSTFKGDCEVCRRPMKVMIKASRSLQCQSCKMFVHKRCHEQVERICVASRCDLDEVEIRICPDRGLCNQNYACAECGTSMSYNGMFCKPTVCDYTGQYFCPDCMSSLPRVTPGRIMRNWDFDPRPVSKLGREQLIAVHDLPYLDIAAVNNSLFAHVEELDKLAKLRKKLVAMMTYLLSCSMATKTQLLKGLRNRPHFVRGERLYSICDMMSLHEKTLLPRVEEIVKVSEAHIREECTTCRSKGFICEICGDDKPIYPFDFETSTQCLNCRSTFHTKCFDDGNCPRCKRLEERHTKAEFEQAGERGEAAQTEIADDDDDDDETF